MAKPNAKANKLRQDLYRDITIKRKDQFEKRLWAKWSDLIKKVRTYGVNDKHWHPKYDNDPYNKMEGWGDFLMEDFDEKDEKTANDEVNRRMGSVLYVFAQAIVSYYHERATTLTDLNQKETVWQDLQDYMARNNDNNEKAIYDSKNYKAWIAEIKVEGEKKANSGLGGGIPNGAYYQTFYGGSYKGDVGASQREYDSWKKKKEGDK